MGLHKVSGAHLGFVNLFTNVPLYSVDEVFHADRLSQKGQGEIVGPEQKTIELRKDVWDKSSKRGQVVLEAFSTSCSTGRMCSSVVKHPFWLM